MTSSDCKRIRNQILYPKGNSGILYTYMYYFADYQIQSLTRKPFTAPRRAEPALIETTFNESNYKERSAWVMQPNGEAANYHLDRTISMALGTPENDYLQHKWTSGKTVPSNVRSVPNISANVLRGENSAPEAINKMRHCAAKIICEIRSVLCGSELSSTNSTTQR